MVTGTTFTVLLQDRPVGRALLYPSSRHGKWFPRTNAILYCQFCGNIFARFYSPDADDWHSFKMCCDRPACIKRNPRHFYYEIPGSVLYITEDTDFLDGLPDAVLLREAILHLNHYYRSISDYERCLNASTKHTFSPASFNPLRSQRPLDGAGGNW